MKVGINGLNLIKHFEQCRLEAFKPIPTDPWTIGWGRAHGVNEGDTCTQEQADQWLVEDASHAEQAVNDGVTAPLGQNEFDALISFTYNVGNGAFLGSTLRNLLNDGRYAEASGQFARWNKSAGAVLVGLTHRREAERRLFLLPDNEVFTI